MDIILEYLPLIWIIVFISLLLLELKLKSLKVIWFSLSSGIAFILSVSPANLYLQVLSFLIIGFLMLFTIKNLASYLLINVTEQNELLNSTGVVVSVEPNGLLVQINNDIYNAKTNSILNINDQVSIDNISDSKLEVNKLVSEDY